ncbi:hypothetical protein [Flavobacterium sp. A45]|uniref:hypothetical protein n=1 Tax=Flavobacterium sp. A45 TaxID=1945862 RepID=UPI00098409F4|nr:hypothetical protein [Flavobacterium sp. A45]OOG69982.1 hypothetical protein B0E44_11635 [Flavobacterium sp. A45]
MKTQLILLTLLFISCLQKENLDYPTEINQIKEVVLERPDRKSHGKFAEVKKLNSKEIAELLEVLNNAKPVGLKKFKIDYYIVFSTKNETRRIMVTNNQIKGYENDYTYQIEEIKFLSDFGINVSR